MVAPTSFFNDYGGHIRILEETLALQELGYQITIATYYKGNDVPEVDIRRTHPLPWHAEYEVGSSRHKIAFDFFLCAKVLHLGFKLRPDIVHGHMHEGALIGATISRILKVPLVFDFQGSLTGEMVDHHFLEPTGFYHKWVWRLERLIDHLPQAIITSSLHAQILLKCEFGVDSKRITPLPDCVDTTRFDPARFSKNEVTQLKEELGIPLEHPIVVYLGLLADYQGTELLINAARILKERGLSVSFLIMGYPRVGYYRQLARDLGVSNRVLLTGKIAYDDAPRYLAIGDIAISAKVSNTEGSGKVLNYMAMSQPVIASDTPVHREYLADLGEYVRPGHATEIADSIARMLDDPVAWKQKGARLRKRAVENYSWKVAAQSIARIYNSLTGSD